MSDEWISAFKFLINAAFLSVLIGGGFAFGVITVSRWMKYPPADGDAA